MSHSIDWLTQRRNQVEDVKHVQDGPVMPARRSSVATAKQTQVVEVRLKPD